MCLNSSGSVGRALTDSSEVQREAEVTVRQTLDARIANARKHLEDLCIQKAKADTAGLLDFPQSVINRLAW